MERMTENNPPAFHTGLSGYLERLVLTGKQRWDKMSPLLRHVAVVLVIMLNGALTPSAEVGEYRICLCNLALGSAFIFGLVGGPSYAIPAFFGLLFFNGTEGYSALENNFVQVSALSALVVFAVSWIAKKLKVRIGGFTSISGLLSFIAVGAILPVAVGGYLLVLGVGHGHIASSLSAQGMDLAIKFVLQSLIGSVLGIAFCVTIFQVLYQLNEVSVYGFVRSSMFMIATLAFLVVMFHVQDRNENEAVMDNLCEQSTNVRNSLDYQITLHLRAVRKLEFLTSLYIADDLNKQDIEQLDFSGEENMPLVFAACIERSDGHNQRVRSPQAGRMNSGARYRMLAYKVFDGAFKEINDYPEGTVIDTDSPLGELLSEVEKADLRGGDLGSNVDQSKKFFFTQFADHNDVLLVAKPCFYKNQCVGIVLTGVSFDDFIVEAMEPFRIINLGIRVSRRETLGNPNSKMVTIRNEMYDPNSFYKTMVPVNFNDSNVRSVVFLELSRSSDSDLFLTHSIENFSFYLLFAVLVGAMGIVLMNQYSRIDEKARQQVSSLDDKERYNSRIAYAMSDLLFTIDSDIKIMSANDAAEIFLGVRESKLLGQNLHEVLHRQQSCLVDGSCELLSYANKVRNFLVHDLHNGSLIKDRLTTSLINSQGEAVCFELTLSFMKRDDGNHNVICVFRNIDKDVRLLKVRSDYVASLSHEMRTPLSCIKGTVDMFTKFAPRMVEGTKFSDKGEQMLEVARRNIDKLNQLISDVLLCDQVDNNTLRIKTTLEYIAPVVKSVVDNMTTIASKAGVSLRLGVTEGRAQVDKVRLDQVLTNLIGNAIKYSGSGTEILVEARLSEDRREIVFSVRDQGEGIPAEKLKTIFDRFAVVSNDSVRKRGGLGLGLTICRGLVNAHGGKIWAESVLGQGSTFKFTLPNVDELAATDTSAQIESPAAKATLQ